MRRVVGSVKKNPAGAGLGCYLIGWFFVPGFGWRKLSHPISPCLPQLFPVGQVFSHLGWGAQVRFYAHGDFHQIEPATGTTKGTGDHTFPTSKPLLEARAYQRHKAGKVRIYMFSALVQRRATTQMLPNLT